MASASADRVVVTGANQGIGHHLLRGLLEDEHHVAALDVEIGNLRDLQEATPERLRVYECDVTDTDEIEAAIADVIEAWGRIDVLVNNAAVATFAPFENRTLEDARQEIEVNYLGYVRTIRAVLPHMRERDRGIVHNVGSATGDVGHPGLSGYAATKGAIAALTRSLRLELRDTGVSCTLMVPPTTNTRMSAGLGYPSWMTEEPDAVGRKLAGKIDSTAQVVTPDRKTSLGLFLIRRFPSLWKAMTGRFVDLGGDEPGSTS